VTPIDREICCGDDDGYRYHERGSNCDRNAQREQRHRGLWRCRHLERRGNPRYLLLSLPCVLVAIILARWPNRFAEHPRFLPAVYGGLIAIGFILIMQAAFLGASAPLHRTF
jgi:hypothetical protein